MSSELTMPSAGPAFFAPAMGSWVVTRYADVVAVLSDPGRFSSALAYETAAGFLGLSDEAERAMSSVVPVDTPHMAAADPPDHTRLRAPLAKSFAVHGVARYESGIRTIADTLIDGFVDRGEADLVPRFTARLPLLSILYAFGVPGRDMAQIQRWYADWVRLTLTRTTAAQQLACAANLVAFQSYLAELVSRRRKAPETDLISQLVEAADGNDAPFTEAELVNMLCQVIAAGTETTTFTLNTCLFVLLRSPGRWSELVADQRRIPVVVEEGLRFNQSMRGVLRVTTEDVNVGGVKIPAGSRLYMMQTAANRDPAMFEEPETFSPGRDLQRRHVAFGYGIHHCLGAPLARLELKIALQRLTARFPGLRLADDHQLSYSRSEVVASIDSLKVVWDQP